MVRFIFVFLLILSSIINIHAKTITFLHDEDIEVKFQDAVHPQILDYAPQFIYPTSTIFQLAESKFHFYRLSFSEKEYYLWMEDLSTDIEINLSSPEINSSNVKMISKSDWYSAKVDLNNSALEELNEIDLYYANALDSLKRLAQTDDQFRAEKNYNTIVWNSRSAKNLYNLAIEKFSYQFDEKWINFIPAYTQYWQLMYKLYYQNYHVNSFKGLNKKEIKSTIDTDFNNPESNLLVFEHFFREGLTVSELKENYEFLKSDLDLKQQNLAEALIQSQAVKEVSRIQKIDFLFGIDIDGSMESYFARDSSEKKHVLVFWSTWDSRMTTEFNLLADLKNKFKEQYNFIHICIDAYEIPDKTKSFIYQNRVGGFHLLPEQSNAFRKSNFRKDQKIRDFPFYVLTDNSGKVIETESVPLEISNRLESKLKHFSTKK
ncbi:thioredoxin-like domain-containing protein [Marivirga salinae]|uniref:Thioredoxin-like domain-containing protein n=1 Tax=Marivirga salinarum TaxID=3059078 RepID=A0AA51RE78_9BACT|nr:thioredoxin-like domain-containing protein [Marivirga sp. BDSF4-3]WMN11939.1 thioredoxin-like domain-containing protein [Marivirga sp. BDSF4-3]